MVIHMLYPQISLNWLNMQIDEHVHDNTTQKSNPSKIYDKVACFIKSSVECLRLETFVFNF